MNFHHDYPLPAYKEEQFEKYFNVETEWMADEGYAESKEVTLRKVAMHVILRVSASKFFLFLFSEKIKEKEMKMNGTLGIENLKLDHVFSFDC